MKLSINALQEIGAFSGAPVEKSIKWRQGENEYEATVFVRRLSYHTTVGELKAAGAKTDPVAERIAASIVDESGNPVFTVADITGQADSSRGALSGPLTVALLCAISEVNELGKL